MLSRSYVYNVHCTLYTVHGFQLCIFSVGYAYAYILDGVFTVVRPNHLLTSSENFPRQLARINVLF